MGGGSSISQGELDELIEETKFKKQELKRWYRKFIKDYPSGQLNKEHFYEVFGKLSTAGSFNAQKADHIFRMFDHNHDGFVSFKELMSTLSLTTRGSVRDKLEWVFDIYDVDGNGVITLEEISEVVTSMQDVSKTQVKARLGTTKVTAVFMAADSDSDGCLTVDEFCDAIEKLPELISILNAE